MTPLAEDVGDLRFDSSSVALLGISRNVLGTSRDILQLQDNLDTMVIPDTCDQLHIQKRGTG